VNPEINFYALRKSPTPYLMHSIMSYNLPQDPHEEVLESLHRSPPRYIVIMEEIVEFPTLLDFINQNYQLETNLDLELLKKLMPFEIYLRKQ
jgi:hypothetical protein